MPAKSITVTAAYRDEKKKNNKVPLTDPDEFYASPEDNFAAESGSGKITDLVLDFSRVSESDVDPAGLKMIKIQKPKAQKSIKKLLRGSGIVTLTIKDLFGTDIDAGELSILKQKHSQAVSCHLSFFCQF